MRRSISSEPYSETMAMVISRASGTIRSNNHLGALPPCKGRLAMPVLLGADNEDSPPWSMRHRYCSYRNCNWNRSFLRFRRCDSLFRMNSCCNRQMWIACAATVCHSRGNLLPGPPGLKVVASRIQNRIPGKCTRILAFQFS